MFRGILYSNTCFLWCAQTSASGLISFMPSSEQFAGTRLTHSVRPTNSTCSAALICCRSSAHEVINSNARIMRHLAFENSAQNERSEWYSNEFQYPPIFTQHPISPQNTCFAYKFTPECCAAVRREFHQVSPFFSVGVGKRKKRSLQLSLCPAEMHMQLCMAQRVRFAIPCSKFFSIYLHMSQSKKHARNFALRLFLWVLAPSLFALYIRT